MLRILWRIYLQRLFFMISCYFVHISFRFYLVCLTCRLWRFRISVVQYIIAIAYQLDSPLYLCFLLAYQCFLHLAAALPSRLPLGAPVRYQILDNVPVELTRIVCTVAARQRGNPRVYVIIYRFNNVYEEYHIIKIFCYTVFFLCN